MADEDKPPGQKPRRRRQRWYISAAALILLAGGYLYLGPLSPNDSGNQWTTAVLLRPVCDRLLDRDHVRRLVGTEAWTWEQTDPSDPTNYTCRLNNLRFTVARFPGPPDQTGGLIGKIGPGTHPEPLGGSGTTSDNLTWVILTCQTGNNTHQLLVSLTWGTNETAVTALTRFASEVAGRQGCQLPDIPSYQPRTKPEPQPLSITEPVCGLLDPTQLGTLTGWTVTRSPGSTGPVNHCAASGPVEPNKPPPPSLIISTFNGPFVGPGTEQLDFYLYTRVCRGTETIYALRTGELALRQAFDKAMQSQNNIRCTGR